jgi:hypothetical protein
MAKSKRRAAAKKGWAKRRRAKAGTAAAPKKRRRKARKAHAAAPRKRRYKRRPGAKRRTGVKTLARARRSIKRARRRGGLAGHYVKRHRMRTNPGLSDMMTIIKTALPVAASLYLTRFIINKVSPMIPGLDKLGNFAKPAISAGMVVAAVYGTKKGPLSKWKDGILMGTSLNLIDSLVGAFAPADVKAMFGLADAGLYDRSLSEYVETGDYLRVGATPIDDDIALSDYVTVNGLEEELGMGALEQELGVEEDLGDDRLGGVSRDSMLAPIPGMSFEAPVPARSFTRQVPRAGGGYDNPNVLYTGVFAGGFGR